MPPSLPRPAPSTKRCLGSGQAEGQSGLAKVSGQSHPLAAPVSLKLHMEVYLSQEVWGRKAGRFFKSHLNASAYTGEGATAKLCPNQPFSFTVHGEHTATQ
jgi:hypothetical protein